MPTTHRAQLLAVLTWLPLLGGNAPHGASASDDITDQQVEQAISRAIEYLWDQQGADGRWKDAGYEDSYPGGVTALAGLALRVAGEGVSKPGMQKAVAYLEKLNREDELQQKVYTRSFALMFWCALDPDKYRRQIKADVAFLGKHQRSHGAWGYGHDPDAPNGWADHSNSQVAILALWEASHAGAEISNGVWQKAAKDWLETQQADGGWNYEARRGAGRGAGSYGSMTAAGLATLYILYDELYANAEGAYEDGAAPQCGVRQSRTRSIEAAIRHAWEWMEKNFVTDRVPAAADGMSMARPDWLTYYLYSVERAGVASGYKYFGERPWYRDVAAELIARQGTDGSWGSVYQTAFGLLALSKGRAAIVFNKLKYADAAPAGAESAPASKRSGPERAEDWINDPRDAATLTHWLARRFETGLTWQTVEIREGEESLRDAPILYISGHIGPRFDAAQRAAIRDYLLSGGTVLAVACCNRREFVDSVAEQFDQMFPRWTRAVLAPDHPLWTIHDRLEPDESLIGYFDGCRTPIFIVQRGLCCAWQQNVFATHKREFELASNLVLYATNRGKLHRKLAPLFPTPRTPFGGKRLRVGRVKHDTDYWIDPLALRRLSEQLIDRARLGIDEVADVALTADLGQFDALFLTGHAAFTLSEPERAGLRRYLEHGGTLFASAACGGPAFDSEFRKVIGATFDASALVPIPPADPLYTEKAIGRGGYDLDAVHYKRAPAGRKLDAQPTPQLLGVRLADRWAVVYSPLDLTCGLVGHDCVDCAGYTSDDARAIGVNVMLYIRSKASR